MDEKDVRSALIEVLRFSLNPEAAEGSTIHQMDSESFALLYRLSKMHDLSHLLSHFVYQNKVEISEEMRINLQRDEFRSVYRYERMQYAFREICQAFDDAGIAYVPLKGSVLRPYYPTESMRTSCDIDVLIHEEDLPLATQALEAKGYRTGDRHYHDVSFYSPNKIHLELHFSIQENRENLDAVLKDVWKHTIPVSGSQMALQKEFFVFHIYAHMTYHFLTGGCGLRSLMDLWIMEHKMDAPFSCAEKLLKQAGIYKFASEMSRVANVCFSGEPEDELSDLILKYVCSGGVYGSRENKMAIQKKKFGSSIAYTWKKLFLPYKTLVMYYPVLRKAPFLLPLCWVARWVKAIFNGGSQRLASELSAANNVSDDHAAEIKGLCSKLGLQ